MIILYKPEGGTEEALDAGRLRASEIQTIERTADDRWDLIKERMRQGDVNALRTVAWAIKRRTHAALRYGDFDPYEDELVVRLDDREVAVYAAGLFEKYRDTEDLDAAFDELRDVAFNREAADRAIADVTAPKDPAPEKPLPEPEPIPAQDTEASPTAS
ncbi:hypothetical protein [Streptomyces sp. A012304]|uniref:hypothetical protein n=1 Tax=Streptomyces sp. A012304 TaxID=375446 RepID=UPI0022314A3E|nr:hypothetical protein [Streptomyces sp. A012304]GKQ34596.1 hypothetical protein ALMP_11450 [Streptomyces sp. A012304]